MLPSGKVRSYLAIATPCIATCISVVIYSILKRPAYNNNYDGLVSVHIHSYLLPNPWSCGYSYKMPM